MHFSNFSCLTLKILIKNSKGVFHQAIRMSSATLQQSVWENDPELYEMIKSEKKRQLRGLELIASENFTSTAVLNCLGSCLTNKYAEGYPGTRFYGGTKFVDQVETLCQNRALSAYRLSPDEWGVNVQPLSGSPANFAVYTGVVEPHGRIMGLDLPDGGHLTHGFFTQNKKISATSIFFESMPYKVNQESGLLDYEALHKTARLFKPKLIIAGVTCYSRVLDYKKFREICDDVGAILMADMAHISGLVVAGVTADPFEYCDIVTTTTHKSLRGPRAGLIFFRKGSKVNEKGEKVHYDFESKINGAVFPGLQGGPHENCIAAIATALKQASTPEFKEYATQIIRNAKRLGEGLQAKGYKVVTGGTDVHMLLIDLRSAKITGAKAEYILEECSIACNKNTVPGDKSALNPSGLRLGTPALTTRGFKESDIDQVVDYIDQAIKLGREIGVKSGPKLVDFKKAVHDAEFKDKVESIRNQVEAFSEKFTMPGFECY
ncbi:unnamed protein product [Ceutorhynchus assimilis]|uniref:Serine hydroxymethyltransferase n=1 Tax=Ceutorhynchus assimilis TaxID=467358 RepID=A0A9N9MQA3_9CUCU|nr:unnamed protein product [Ceutorhynchus assimilis]